MYPVAVVLQYNTQNNTYTLKNAQRWENANRTGIFQ
jgi:hypothetical protein